MAAYLKFIKKNNKIDENIETEQPIAVVEQPEFSIQHFDNDVLEFVDQYHHSQEYLFFGDLISQECLKTKPVLNQYVT